MNPRFLLLLMVWGILVPWGRAGDLPAPEIRRGLEYEFPTTDGMAYLVEGSTDGQTWAPVAGPVFGDGGKARSILPAAATGSPRQLRVRTVSAAAYGPATTQLGGKTLTLNDEGRARQLIFFPVIQGIRRGVLKTDATHARSFVWQGRRTTGADAKLELHYFDGTSSTIDLNFSHGQLGAYQLRDRDGGGVVQVTEGGGFSLHTGRIRDEANEAVLPSSLGGQSLLLEEGGALTRFDFDTEGNVTLISPDGSTRIQRYQYNRSAPSSADLRVEAPGGPGENYQLQLSSQATGKYERMPLPLPGGGFPPGTLPRSGVFNIPTVPVVPNSITGPPKSLSGKILQLNGDDPVTLTFYTDGTGTATREDNGSVEISAFTYDYSPTDDDEASLALTFPGAQSDRVEDYDLEFSGNSAGSYRTSSYEGGELARSSSGSFNAGGS